MKCSCISLLLFFLLFSFANADDEYTVEEIKGKITSYTKMKITGFTLLGIGGAALVTGIILAANADWVTRSTPTGVQKTTDDPQGGVGIIMLAAGIPMAIVGTVLGTIGASKTHEYKQRLELSGVGIYLTPEKQYIGLTFTF